MASRSEKIDTLLGEYRIVVPALGALLGFQLTLAFSQGFERLSGAARWANFAGVLCTAAAFVLLVVPAGYHRFTARVDESEEFLRFTQRIISVALLFVAAGLSLSLYVQAERTLQDPLWALLPAGAVAGGCGALWWWLPVAKARRLETR